MRICLVSLEYPPGRVGGIGTQCRLKARGLTALGHEVEVLTAGDEDGPALDTREDEGWRVHELHSPGGDFEVYNPETYRIGYTWTVLGGLRALTAERSFEVIDFPDYSAEGLAYQLDRPLDDPTATVVHLHGSLAMFAEKIGWPEPHEPLHRVGIFMEDLSTELADRVIAASASIADLTADRLEIPRAAISVVGGAVDTELFTPPNQPPAEGRGPRLLFVGSVAANKGILSVIDAFIALADRHPGMTLTIAGSGDAESVAEVRGRIADAGLLERVQMLGFVEHDELADVYRAADLLAGPSTYEGGLGMVYLEAMASGLPVIAVAAGGAAEAIVDGETGRLLERGDGPETTAAIAALLEDPELGARMGTAGRRRVLGNFTLDRYAARIEEAYLHAIERRRASVVVW